MSDVNGLHKFPVNLAVFNYDFFFFFFYITRCLSGRVPNIWQLLVTTIPLPANGFASITSLLAPTVIRVVKSR